MCVWFVLRKAPIMRTTNSRLVLVDASFRLSEIKPSGSKRHLLYVSNRVVNNHVTAGRVRAKSAGPLAPLACSLRSALELSCLLQSLAFV
jgi:hypothetical protein